MAKPKPIAKNVVCSECGLPWDEHTKGRKTDPTQDVCIRLLRVAMAKRPAALYTQPFTASGPGFKVQPAWPTWGNTSIVVRLGECHPSP